MRADRAVLMDRLRQVLEAPYRAQAWHGLYAVLVRTAGPDRQALLAELRKRRPRVGTDAAQAMAGVLAASFLDSFTADESELALASAACCAAGLPYDAGVALLNISYARALRSSAGSADFVAMLARAGFVELCQHLGQRLLLQRQARPAPSSAAVANTSGHAKLRIAVVAPSLSSGFHAPTLMALSHACLLHDLGHEVRVFAPQEFLMADMPQWLGTPRDMALGAADRSLWPKPGSGALAVTLARPDLAMHGRWHGVLDAVDAFAPDSVFFIGPHSPLLTPLHARYWLVGLGSNAVAPLGPLDVWLAPHAAEHGSWGPEVPVRSIVPHSQRLWVDQAPAAMPRSAIDVPAQATLWLTSGSRLATEMSAAWCAEMLKALLRHPLAHWLIVSAGRRAPEGLPLDHPRIHLRGFEKDLGGLMLSSDVYLNPPRLGGGHSVAMAMAHGLPVLALRGGDGGDKLGPLAQPDVACYFSELDRLTLDAAHRGALAAQQRQRFSSVFDLKQAGAALEQALRPPPAAARP